MRFTCLIDINLSWNADTKRSNGCRTNTNVKRFDNFSSLSLVLFKLNEKWLYMWSCSCIALTSRCWSFIGTRFISENVSIQAVEATFGTWQYAKRSFCSVMKFLPGNWIQCCYDIMKWNQIIFPFFVVDWNKLVFIRQNSKLITFVQFSDFDSQYLSIRFLASFWTREQLLWLAAESLK